MQQQKREKKPYKVCEMKLFSQYLRFPDTIWKFKQIFTSSICSFAHFWEKKRREKLDVPSVFEGKMSELAKPILPHYHFDVAKRHVLINEYLENAETLHINGLSSILVTMSIL